MTIFDRRHVDLKEILRSMASGGGGVPFGYQGGYYIGKDIEIHPEIHKHFWDQEHWPKHVLVRYTWEEQSEIDVAAGFYVLFGSGLVLSFILAIYVLQSSQDKLTRFVRETVAESSMPGGGVAKVE